MAEGIMFIMQSMIFSFMYLNEHECLKAIIEAGITHNPNFYYRNHNIEPKYVYKKVIELMGEQNKQRSDKIDPHHYDNIFFVKDIIKLKICELNCEKYLIEILKNSNNMIQIKEVLGLIKKFFTSDAYNRKVRDQRILEVIECIIDIPLKMQQNTKQLPANYIEKLLKTIQQISNMGLQYSEVERIVNLLELEFYFVYFSSQQLQQKVTGITNIIQKINKLIEEDSAFSMQQYSVFYFKPPPESHISTKLYLPIWSHGDDINVKKSILEWVKHKQIFERIFNEYSHHEIIKRSYPIVKFLYLNQSFSHDQILFIYRLAAGKHHSLRTCVYSLLNSLVDILDINDLELIFNEVKRTPFADIDLDCINLIRAMLLNSKLSSVRHIPASEMTNQQNQKNMVIDGQNPQYGDDTSKDRDEENNNNKDQYLINNFVLGSSKIFYQLIIIKNIFFNSANNERNQNNDTDEDVRSNEASSKLIKRAFQQIMYLFLNKIVGDEYQIDSDNLNNDEVKKSIEKHIQKNQFEFEISPNVCDITQDKMGEKRYKRRGEGTDKKGKGRKYRSNRNNNNNDDTSNFGRGGKYVTVVSKEGINMYEYLWSIIQYGCTKYNTMSQELINKAIEIMKQIVEQYFRPLKFDLLNKCVEMINQEEMIDQSLDFICSLNKSLPIEDINDDKIFSSSEELFSFLDQKIAFSSRILISIQKYRVSFIKLIQLLHDFKKININQNGMHSSPISPSPYQMEDEVGNNHPNQKQNEMIKKSPIRADNSEMNINSPFRNDQQSQQLPSITQKIKQEALRIPNLNFRILNAIDEQTLQNFQKVCKEYIETCKERLKAILESLRGMKRDFNVSLIKNLFEMFCQNEYIPQEKELFYNLLIQLVTEQRQMNKVYLTLAQNDQNYGQYNQQQSRECFEILNKENFSFIFNDILLRFDISYFSPVVMNCLEAYFFYINEYIKNFTQIQGNSFIINLFEPSKTCPSSLDPQSPTNFITYQITTDQIQGIERFWELYLRHQDQAISNHAGTILSRIIMLSTQYSDSTISENIKQLYIQQIMRQLKDAYEALITNSSVENLNTGINNLKSNNINLFKDQYQDEVGLLKQHYNQVLQRSLDLFSKLLKNLDKASQPITQQQNSYKTLTIQVDNQIQSQKQEKFSIQIRTNQTIREVFTIIGDRINPRLNADQIEAYCQGIPILDLNKLVSYYKIQDNNTFLVKKSDPNAIMNYDEISAASAIPMGYQVIEGDNKPKTDLKEKIAQVNDVFQNTYNEGFIEFVLREKKEDVEEVITFFLEGYEVNEYENRYLMEISNETANVMNPQNNDQMNGPVFEKENNEFYAEGIAQNDFIEEENRNLGDNDDLEGKDGKISFAKIISNHEEYFEFLFQLLEIDNPQLQQKIWDIITTLPVSKKSSNVINELCLPSENPLENAQKWAKFLNVQNKYVVLYRLSMILKIVNCNTEIFTSGFNNQQVPNDPREREVYFQRKNFRINFIKSDGFAFLYNALIGVNLQEFFQIQNIQQNPINNPNNDQDINQNLQNQNQIKSFQSILFVVKTYVEAYMMNTSHPQSPLRNLILQNQSERCKNNAVNTSNNNNNNNNNQQRGNRHLQNNDNQMQIEGNKNQFIGPTNNPNKQVLRDEEIAMMESKNNENKMEEMPASAPNQNTNNNNQNQNNQSQNIFREIFDLVQAIQTDQTLQLKIEQVINLQSITKKCIEVLEVSSTLFAQTQDIICEDMLFEALSLIQSCIIFNPENIIVLKEYQRIHQLLVFQLFSCQSLRIRYKTTELVVGVTHLIEQLQQQQQQQMSEGLDHLKPRQFFIKTLLGLFQEFINNPSYSTCDEYIQTILVFLQGVDEEYIKVNFDINIVTLYTIVLNGIQNRPIIETRYSNNQDRVLTALFKFAQELITKKYDLANLNPQFIQNMIDFLFYIPSQDMDVQNFVDLPKCKHRETRQAALKLILTICSYSAENFQMVFRTIQANQQHLNINEQDLEVNLKPAHNFVGLKNLGCTCYINSLLQQFFMIKDFRRAIINAQIVINPQQAQAAGAAAAPSPPTQPAANVNNNVMEIDEVQQPKRQNVDGINDQMQQLYKEHTLFQLQALFAQMESTIKQYVWPTSLIESIKGFDGEQINVRVQQDVNEFFNLITDKLEDELKPTQQKQLLQELIGGQLSNEIISLEEEYPFLAETIEPYLTITVDIQKCKNLYEALDTQIKGDTLDGDNMYFCEKYQRKIKAQKRSCIKSLPNNLVLTLKRFDFDFITMEKKKINDYLEFPLELNLRNWTKQKLFEQEGRNLNEQDIHPDDYYCFKLAGVLVHNGTAESGHYYSFIKNREDSKWYEFNDSYVKEFNVENISDECYGGKSQTVFRNQMWESDYNKSRNAYILFYERVNPYPHKFQALVNQPISGDLIQKMKDENREFWKSRYIFDSDYFNFVREFIFSYQFSEFTNINNNISLTSSQVAQIKWMKEFQLQIAMTENDYDQNEIDETELQIDEIPFQDTLEYHQNSQDIQILQFALNNLVENQSRSKDYQSFCQALKQIQSVLAKNYAACFWFLDCYLAQRKYLIVALLLDQFNYEIRDRFQDILIQCIENIYQIEKSYILRIKSLKRAVEMNNNYLEIQNYSENISCLYRFANLFLFQMQESFHQNFNKASNYLQIVKYLVTNDNQFIQIMNDFGVTKNYMFYLNNLVKKQLNNSQQYQDQNVQKNTALLLDILTQITIRCVTRGMHMTNLSSPVFFKNANQIDVNLEIEIENSILNYFKEYQQICYYVNDPYQIFIHICWGNEQTSKKLISSLKDFVVDISFQFYNCDTTFRIAKDQFDLQDGFSEMRIKQFFFSGLPYERTFKKLEFRTNSSEQTCMEFIKFICDYSNQNPLFFKIISAPEYQQETKWIKSFLKDQADDKSYRNMNYNHHNSSNDKNRQFGNKNEANDHAKDLLRSYIQLFDEQANNQQQQNPQQQHTQQNDDFQFDPNQETTNTINFSVQDYSNQEGNIEFSPNKDKKNNEINIKSTEKSFRKDENKEEEEIEY